jgi:hypothetical protein
LLAPLVKHSVPPSGHGEAPAQDYESAYSLIQLAFRFWEAKALLSAVKLGIFDALGVEPVDGETLAARVGLHPRGARDFLDALVALGLLARSGNLYSVTRLADQYLDRDKPTYIGGLMELADSRLYPVWGDLETAIRTGEPQNEARHVENYYGDLTRDSERLQVFLQAMTGLSMDAARQIPHRFDWAHYSTFADIGGAQGVLSVQLALAHPHLFGYSFDLPPVAPIFEQYVERFGLSGRLTFRAGDFFKDDLPAANVLIMGHVLHNWDLDDKKLLIRKAYEALPSGGALLAYDAVMDEERKHNAFALLMSLNMLLVTAGGFTYTVAECISWMQEAGFKSAWEERLTGTDSLIIAMK